MKTTESKIKGLYIVEPTIYGDERGYFFESYNKNVFASKEIFYNFVQDNQSSSEYGVIRGLHLQKPPFAQTKLVRVLAGTILDVAVDLRRNSETYGEIFTIELSADNRKHLLIPKGFAHGFSVLSPYAVVFYKCDEYYNKSSEDGIIYSDSTLNIDWKIPANKHIISPKDLNLTAFDKLHHCYDI